jgi:hypothetical protein
MVGLAYVHISNHKLNSDCWDELIARLDPVPHTHLETVALDHLEPRANQLRLEPEDMWSALGGIEGLKRMKRNADVLVALASYVARWNFEEGVIVAERMRRDGIHLRRAVFHVRIEFLLHRHPVRLPFYLHEAASSYYLMAQRLLALYETNHAGLYPRLSGAV